MKEAIIQYNEEPDDCGTPMVISWKELVRCRDCKYWYFADNRVPSERENVCGRNGIVVTPDWFCADGEKK